MGRGAAWFFFFWGVGLILTAFVSISVESWFGEKRRSIEQGERNLLSLTRGASGPDDSLVGSDAYLWSLFCVATDPEKAFDLAAERPRKNKEFLVELLRNWGKVDPEKALQKALSLSHLPDIDHQRYFVDSIRAMGINPASDDELRSSLERLREKKDVSYIGVVMQEWARSDVESALAAAERLIVHSHAPRLFERFIG